MVVAEDYLVCNSHLFTLKLVTFMNCVFSAAMGFWWLVLILGMVLFMLAHYTKNGWIVAMASVLMVGFLGVGLPAAAQPIMYFIAVIGLATILYAAYRGRDQQ